MSGRRPDFSHWGNLPVSPDPLHRSASRTSAARFRDDGAAALEWAARYLEQVGDYPVLAQVEPGEIRSRLPASPPERGEPFADVLRDVDEILLPGVTHWQSPRFFAYFAATASEPGILAELLAATLNQVGFIWRTSPASTELEALTLDWTAQLLGLPAGWHGHIEDSGSVSTLAALAAGREQSSGRVVVCSEEAHSSVERAARLLGLETRKIPSDDKFRMRVDALDLSDAAALVATVGTTSTTSVDPVPELADACESAGVWLHVDAAYAGSAWVCPELRWSQAGVERADSLVVNAHKWLFTPMDCSLLWTRRHEALRAAFSLVPEYLRTPDEADSLSDYVPALGRRFRALKLWTVLRCYGREGLQARIRETIRLAALFEDWVRADPDWEVCAPRHFSTICFRRCGPDEENEAIVERVNRSGEVFLSHTRLEGRYVIRLAVGNERTSEADVRRAWIALASGAA
jgi:aromatic-L-amino-acid decarboxylase